MNDKLNIQEIREFWATQALQHGMEAAASWSDTTVMEMEVRELLRHMVDSDKILDVGCANGYSTLQFATNREINIRGLDYIPEMINQARARLSLLATSVKNRVTFEVGDITHLDEIDNFYDKVVVIRVVINLRDWTTQLNALEECIRVLKPGGAAFTI